MSKSPERVLGDGARGDIDNPGALEPKAVVKLPENDKTLDELKKEKHDG